MELFFHIYKIHADFALALNSAMLGTGTNVLNTNICVNNKKACAKYMDIQLTFKLTFSLDLFFFFLLKVVCRAWGFISFADHPYGTFPFTLLYYYLLM